MGGVLQTWTSAQVRAAEQPLLAAGEPLMERAAFALHVHVARALEELRGRVAGSRVVVLAGSGNNGGDALYAGALLARRGAEVHAVLTSERAHEGGLAALRAGGGRVRALDDD
ncbi:NAD(P)H-hydrate epimerase, partial [Cellulomonas sp. P5_E12]